MTIDDIKVANLRAGYYFFSVGALRFFRSRVSSLVYEGPGGIFFVTSEQFESSTGRRAKRQYTVRQFDPDTARCQTVGAFNRMSRSGAHAAAARLMATGATQSQLEGTANA